MALKYRIFCKPPEHLEWEECAQIEDTVGGLEVDTITNDIALRSLVPNPIDSIVEIRRADGTTVISRFIKKANF